MGILKNLFRKRTKEEKLNSYGNYLCACMCCGEMTGKDATEFLLDYKNSLDEIRK